VPCNGSEYIGADPGHHEHTQSKHQSTDRSQRMAVDGPHVDRPARAAALTEDIQPRRRGTGATLALMRRLHTKLIFFRVALERSCAWPVKVAEGAPTLVALRGEK
jgi:hypothetical protein